MGDNDKFTMQKTYARDKLTWLAYFVMAFYGFFINVIGPITPYLKDELNLSYTVASLHYSLFALGILLIGLMGNAIITRLGRWRAWWLGAAGVSAGALALIAAQNPVITIGATFVMGLIGSLILILVPLVLSDHHGDLRAVGLFEANLVASLVAAVAPLLVGVFARTSLGWRAVLAAMSFAPILLYFIFRDVRLPAAAPIPKSHAPTAQNLPRAYWLFWLCLVLGVAVEFCMLSWSADFLKTTWGMTQADAAQSVSIFLAAMIAGRVVGSRLAQRISAQHLVMASVCVALAGFLCYWLGGSAQLALLGLFLTGLGVASLYPLILSLAIETAPGQSALATTRASLASGVAILVLPLFLGRMADAVGIRLAYGVVVAVLVGLLAILLAARKKSAQKSDG